MEYVGTQGHGGQPAKKASTTMAWFQLHWARTITTLADTKPISGVLEYSPVVDFLVRCSCYSKACGHDDAYS